ncbi:Glutathione S-transferase 1 [Blattella germanica]|nr:Glutathione S-transferase 1 [Blattella germanica]
MTIDLHYTILSAPCRSVMLTAKAAGIELNLIECNLFKGEHMKPEFQKMNPQHCVPTLNDNGFCLGESRAICTYLLDQYAKDDSLYPKDPKKRALVDQKLYFDATNIYQRFIDYYCAIMWWGKEPEPAKYERFQEAVQILDKFLEGNKWVTGDNLTVADIDLVTTVTSAEV